MEIWKEIKGYEGIYEVSNLGRVKRLSINKLNGRFYSVCKEKFLKFGLSNGYYNVTLSKDLIKKTKTVHQLVAEAFLNHISNGYKLVVNHIDFNILNNHIENLEVVTQRENSNKKHIKSTSKYTGVSFKTSSNKWLAQIIIKRKVIFLGYFINEIDAHNAYQKALNNL